MYDFLNVVRFNKYKFNLTNKVGRFVFKSEFINYFSGCDQNDWRSLQNKFVDENEF